MYQTFIQDEKWSFQIQLGLVSDLGSLYILLPTPEAQTTACLSIRMENKPNQRLRSLGWEKQSISFTHICRKGQAQAGQTSGSDCGDYFGCEYCFQGKLKFKENLTRQKSLRVTSSSIHIKISQSFLKGAVPERQVILLLLFKCREEQTVERNTVRVGWGWGRLLLVYL